MTISPKGVTRITISLPDELYEALEEEAEVSGQALSHVVRNAVSHHLFDTIWRSPAEVLKEALLAEKTNEETLAIVKAKFPDTTMTTGSVVFYRSHLRGLGEPIRLNSELERSRKQ